MKGALSLVDDSNAGAEGGFEITGIYLSVVSKFAHKIHLWIKLIHESETRKKLLYIVHRIIK